MRNFFVLFSFFGILFFSVCVVVGVLLSNTRDYSEYYPYQRWQEFYKQPENTLDLVFIGSSYSYRSFIPSVIDSLLHTNSFNMGSSNQIPSTSYYVLKEVLKYQKPKTVVMEVNHRTLKKNNLYISALHNIDFIESFNVRAELALSHFTRAQLSEYLFPIYRFNNYKTALVSGGKRKIKHIIKKNVYSGYRSGGFVATYPNRYFDLSEVEIREDVSIGNFDSTQLKYLHEIEELCHAKGITILFVAHPMNPLIRNRIQDYGILMNRYDQAGLNYGDNFVDMNVQPHQSLFETDDFYDEEHLFYHGAVKASKLIAKIISEKVNEPYSNKAQ